MGYQLTDDPTVVKLQPNGKERGSTHITPTDTRWGAYQDWLAQGNTPDPADPPPPPPPNRSFPPAAGNSIPDLRAEVNALRQILIDYGIVDP